MTKHLVVLVILAQTNQLGPPGTDTVTVILCLKINWIVESKEYIMPGLLAVKSRFE